MVLYQYLLSCRDLSFKRENQYEYLLNFKVQVYKNEEHKKSSLYPHLMPDGSAVCSPIPILAQWLTVVCKRSAKEEEEAALRTLVSCKVSWEGLIAMWQRTCPCLSPVWSACVCDLCKLRHGKPLKLWRCNWLDSTGTWCHYVTVNGITALSQTQKGWKTERG